MIRGSHTTSGFSLIELMITVAIVAILASIAIPNLLMFQSSARQTEVQVTLTALARTLHARMGSGLAIGCGLCGFVTEGSIRYSYYADASTSLTGTNGCSESDAGLLAAVQTPQSPGSPAAFTVGAAGNIDADTTCDAWNMNDNLDLVHVVDDIDG